MLLLVLWTLPITAAAFAPNLTITSCSGRTVELHVTRAARGGILFIQGGGAECKRPTVAEPSTHSFKFEHCNIEYDSKFRVVIQEHAHYQTGSDVVVPIMCLLDTSALIVSNVIFPAESPNDRAINKTIRPTVSMRIASSDDTKASRADNEVSINDTLKLVLTLDSLFQGDFDIKARDCVASRIPLVENECSKNEDLFPNFSKETRGALMAAFKAFAPTNLLGNSDVDVAFSCNVTVCRGECHQAVCGEIVGWGRKRRQAEVNDDVYENVTVGAKIRVRRVDPDRTALEMSRDSDVVCGSRVLATAVLAVAIATVVFSWLVCGCVTAKLRHVTRLKASHNQKPSGIRRMSETGVNFARSVGRRLSTMLNIPVGYDVKEPKMMDNIPENLDESPPAKRRDSVTVSTRQCSQRFAVDLIKPYDVLSNANFNLRKRLVDSSSQTDLDNGRNLGRKLAKKNPFSFITSISIKSGIKSPTLTADRRRNDFIQPSLASKSFDLVNESSPDNRAATNSRHAPPRRSRSNTCPTDIDGRYRLDVNDVIDISRRKSRNDDSDNEDLPTTPSKPPLATRFQDAVTGSSNSRIDYVDRRSDGQNANDTVPNTTTSNIMHESDDINKMSGNLSKIKMFHSYTSIDVDSFETPFAATYGSDEPFGPDFGKTDCAKSDSMPIEFESNQTDTNFESNCNNHMLLATPSSELDTLTNQNDVDMLTENYYEPIEIENSDCTRERKYSTHV